MRPPPFIFAATRFNNPAVDYSQGCDSHDIDVGKLTITAGGSATSVSSASVAATTTDSVVALASTLASALPSTTASTSGAVQVKVGGLGVLAMVFTVVILL